MRKTLFMVTIGFLLSMESYAQRPFLCGHYPKDLQELTDNYERYLKFLGVKYGERVASVGASSGYNEMHISCFVENIDWTIQDIDTACLNKTEFLKVRKYYEGLIGRPLKGQVNLVIGESSKTNLPRNTYDRLLLVQVYHELAERKESMRDIHGSLKKDGLVVILERMATKKGQLTGDCRRPMLWEPDFIQEMKDLGFEMVDKIQPEKKIRLVLYTFKQL